MADKSYIGKGKVYLNGRQVGNVSTLSIQAEEDEQELPDYTTGGGGNYNSLKRISSVSLSLTMHDYSAENLAVALFGSSSAVTATAVTAESIAAPASVAGDPLVRTASVIDTAQTVTVTSDPAGTTYTAGTDYTVSAAGITILATGSIAATTALLVSYTKKAVDVVEALTTAGSEYEVTFDGLNEAQSGTPVVITAYRVKFGPAADLAMIGDEFAALELTADVLKDTTITGAGLSQYLKVQAA